MQILRTFSWQIIDIVLHYLNMAGRCVMGTLIVFLSLSIILNNLSKDYRRLSINEWLEILEASNETRKVKNGVFLSPRKRNLHKV